MRHLVKLASAASLCALSVTAASAAPIVYSVSASAGAVGSLTGTLTTDGTIGTITSANFVAWNLVLTGRDQLGHTVVETLTNLNSGVFSASNYSNGFQGTLAGLTATATSLSFDFSNPTPGFLLFQKVFGSAASFACISRGDEDVCGGVGFHVDPLNTDADGTNAGQGPSNATLPPPSGVVVFATSTAVPEPATWLSMIFGMGLVGGSMRSRLAKPSRFGISFS